MKIVRLSTFLDYGGIESKMSNLSGYQDNDNEWIFAAIGKGGVASDQIAQNGKRVVLFHYPYKIPSFVTLYKLYRYFKKEKPTVVHTSGAEANFHGILAGKLAGVPNLVSEEIGIPSHSFIARMIFKIIYFLSDFVLGESKIVCDNLLQNYSVSPKKIKIVPNFISALNKENSVLRRNENDSFHIVSVSRLEPVKNIEGIISVVNRLKKEGVGVKYTIVGDGSQKEFLEGLCNAIGLNDVIVFAGFQKDPFPYLYSADLFVLNSHTEGFSNSMLESMSIGVPVLSTKVGAAAEILQDGINGWIINPNDDEALYQKIKEIIAIQEMQRRQIGKNGTQTVADRFTLEKHIAYLIEIYKSKQ